MNLDNLVKEAKRKIYRPWNFIGNGYHGTVYAVNSDVCVKLYHWKLSELIWVPSIQKDLDLRTAQNLKEIGLNVPKVYTTLSPDTEDEIIRTNADFYLLAQRTVLKPLSLLTRKIPKSLTSLMEHFPIPLTCAHYGLILERVNGVAYSKLNNSEKIEAKRQHKLQLEILSSNRYIARDINLEGDNCLFDRVKSKLYIVDFGELVKVTPGFC